MPVTKSPRTRDGLADAVRRLLRQLADKPLTDDHIFDAIDDATDDLVEMCPFYVVTETISSVEGQREYAIPLDLVRIVDLNYIDATAEETDVSPQRLTPTTLRNIGDANPGYLGTAAGTPTQYYSDTGILGFDVPTAKTGEDNIILRGYGRPDYLDRGESDVEFTWLPHALRKAFKYKVAAILATVLGQDQTALQQAGMWNGEYLAGVARYNALRHEMEQGLEAQIIPVTGRR